MISFALLGLSLAIQPPPSRAQMIEDARAMVREQWADELLIVDMIQLGAKCGVLDKFTAELSVQNVGNDMERQKIAAGLIGDTVLTALPVIQKRTALNSAKFATKTCDALRPEDRGRMRQLATLMIGR